MGWIYLLIISSLSGLCCGMNCGDPSKPNHSIYNFTGLSTPGSVVFYSCHIGYRLIGSATRRCYENGTWLPYQPICEPENVTCGFPGHGPHGRVDISGNSFTPGSMATYTCDLGYVLVGPTQRICQQDGRWSYPVPQCAAKVSMHRRISKVSQFVDIYDKPEKQGIAILDDKNFVCSVAEKSNTQTSFWQVDLLEAQRIDVVVLIFGDKTDVDVNLRVSNSSDYNKTALTNNDYSLSKWTKPYITREGSRMITIYEYSLKGGYQFQYITVETKPTPTLEKLNFCELLVLSKTAPSFGQCFSPLPGSFTPADTTAAIHKNTCYSFAHSNAVSWSTADVKCRESTNGGLVTDVDLDVQSLMKYTLNGAYDGKQIDRSYWIGGISIMNEAKSNMPWIWKNDNIIRTFYWGRNQPDLSQSEPACLSVNGNLDWLWDDKMCTNLLYSICQHRVLQCGTPELPENVLTDYSKLNTYIGASVTYFCPEGYSLQGNRERQCLDNGEWSGSAPFCFLGDSNERQRAENTEVGVIAAIVCGVILGALLLIAVVCFLAYRKNKSGSKSMKFSKQSESAETLDVHDKKSKDYSSTDVEK